MAGWLDYLNPQLDMYGLVTPRLQSPNTYDYFRSFYPPASRPMMGGGSLPSPGTAPAPNEPRSAFPGFGPQMTGDIGVGSADEPGALPAGWNSANLARNVMALPGPIPGFGPHIRNFNENDMAGGDPMRVRINKPNVIPAGGQPPAPPSKPAPMMGNAPDMGLWNATASPATPDAPARSPTGWGSDNPLWSMLMAAGPAMMQPSWYGLGGQLGQGMTAAAEAARKAPTEKLQRRLMEAQVGKAEADTAARSSLTEFARRANLPAGVMLALQLNPEKAGDILEKYDPAMKEAYLKFAEEKSAATAKGSSPYDIMKAAAGATNVGIKMSTEYQSKLDNLAKFEGIANDATKSPAERQSARDMAQSIRRDITQKDGPPKGWVDEISGMAQGVKAAEEIKALVKQHGVTPLNPAARAEIAQQYSYVLNAMKKSENFGAALTGNEQKILENGVRNPNDFFNNILLGSQTHIRLLDKYIAYTRDRAQMQQNMYRTGDLPPELSRGPSVPAPPPGFRHMNR